MTRKGVGPIDSFESASYDFEYIWYTDVVDYAKLRSIVVQYKDGTSKTYKGEWVLPIPSDALEAIDYTSPVENLLPFREDKK